MSNISEEAKLRGLLENRQLEPFIEHIRFPYLKNLSPDTRIEFSYPITALVGANGTNKSTVLRAIQGSPGYSNLGQYWFSTSIDPITDQNQNEEGGRPCFIYGYWNAHAGKTVEIIKTRIHKANDPDYWEPSRAIAKYGMEEIPPLPEGVEPPAGRFKTRWNTIDKPVSYLDFRADLSAYDKFFYHGELRNRQSTPKSKKEFIRRNSPHLKSAIENKSTSYNHYGVERIIGKENRLLSPEELFEVSFILGRAYSEISIIRHTFFNCDAYTAIMKVAELKYSEAFAGSGEFAVIRLVIGVMTAPEKSLILLDEPEVSLHPGAQDRLMTFLAKMVKLRKQQFVIATHSPAIIRHLPPDAIKVFVMSKSGKVVVPSQKAFPEEAFFHLGEPIPGKITVVVEDPLAEAIVRRAIRLAGEAASNLFDVRYYAGGSQTLWAHYITVFSAEDRSDILVLLDGDRRPATSTPDSNTIQVANEDSIQQRIHNITKVDVGDLQQLIFDMTGVDVLFKIDGGDGGTNTSQLNQLRKKYICWTRVHVDYLPGTGSPEAFLWGNMEKDAASEAIEEDDAKRRFAMLTRKELGLADHEKESSSDILSTQRRRLATIPDNHAELIKLRDKLLAAIPLHSK